jgi:outer membrane protein assembly factor BamB
MIFGGLAVLCAVCVACAAENRSEPGDWPSFRQNLQQTGIAESPLPQKLELLWETTVGEQVLATCAIVGERVYVPCLSGEIVCLNRRDGKKLWAYASVEKPEPNTIPPGFKSSPTVADGTVYLGDEEGVFHAIDAESGKGRWTFPTGGEIFSCAAVLEDKILFGSYDNALYCLNAKGEQQWKFETQGYVHCSPAVIEGRTFISGCDEHLRVIDVATGDELADLPLQTYLIASPAIRGDHLYVGTYGGEVAAVDWKQAEIAWRKATGMAQAPIHSSAAVTEDLVVVGSRDKSVTALDRQTGAIAWNFLTRGRVDSSPAIVGHRVFIGSADGNLYELNLANGKEVWKFNAGKPISAGPAIGDGVLVIGSESRDGKVYCFGAKENGK